MIARFAGSPSRRWELSPSLEQCFVYSIEETDAVPPQRPINVQTIEEWKVSGASYDPPFQLAVFVNSRESEQTTFTASPEFLKEVLRGLELPEVIAAWWAVRRTTSMEIPCPLTSSTITMLSFGYWMIAWRSDATSSKVRAVILSMNDSSTNKGILDNVQGFLEEIPLTMPYHQLAGTLAVLLSIKIGTDFWIWATNSGVSTYKKLQNILKSNNLQQAEELSNLTVNQHIVATCTSSIRRGLDVAASCVNDLLDGCRSRDQQDSCDTHPNFFLSLKRLVESLAAENTVLMDLLAMNTSLIYSLTTQRDQANSLAIAAATQEIAVQSRRDQENSLAIANASKRIAEETRRDSRAMKMIAIVTMIYLPGTFVATAFSMGIFNWSASSSEVVNPRIWAYFLFTGILTILTIGGFLGWTWWQERRPKREADMVYEVAESVETTKPTLKTE